MNEKELMTTIGNYKFFNAHDGIISVKNQPLTKKITMATLLSINTFILYLLYLAADESFIVFNILFIPLCLLVLMIYLVMFKLSRSSKGFPVVASLLLLLLLLIPIPIRIFSLGTKIPMFILIIGLYLILFTLLPCYLANFKYKYFMDPHSRMIGERSLLSSKIHECGLGVISGFFIEKVTLTHSPKHGTIEYYYRFDIFAVGQYSKKQLFSDFSEEKANEVFFFLNEFMNIDTKVSVNNMVKLRDNYYKADLFFHNGLVLFSAVFLALVELYAHVVTIFF
jgi:hypothetical protein